MTGWLIYDAQQAQRNQWFAQALLHEGCLFSDLKLVLAESLTYGVADRDIFFRIDGEPVLPPDYAIVRTIYPLLSETLEHAGVRVFNRAAISHICNDKRRTYAVARSAGTPVLPTVFCDRRFFSPHAAREIGYPLVLKSAAGHGGKEVYLLEDEEALISTVSKLPADDFLLQKLLRPYGRDLRVYVLGGKILRAVMRTSGGFKSNYSLGGSASLYDLDKRDTELVYRVLAALPCPVDLVGIDLMPGIQGLIFNEIEDVVGCRMLYETTDLPVEKIFMHYIQDAMNE